jgi:hypothetical protein
MFPLELRLLARANISMKKDVSPSLARERESERLDQPDDRCRMDRGKDNERQITQAAEPAVGLRPRVLNLTSSLS